MQKKSLLSRFALLSLLFFLFPLSVHADAKVTINEFVPHPGSGNKEWVEFYNPDNVDISGYWIDDDTDFQSDAGSSSKKILSGITTGKDTTHPFFELSSSMFNNSGDRVVLFDASGTIVDQYEYKEDPGADIPIGRSPDGTGNFQTLAYATKGDTNADPLPTETPTPTPSPAPSHTPAPTHLPMPTKNSTPTRTPAAISPDSTNNPSYSSSTNSPTINLREVPTSILGISTSAASEKTSPQPGKKILIQSSAKQYFPLINIALIIGSVCFLACGILVFLKIRNENQDS